MIRSIIYTLCGCAFLMLVFSVDFCICRGIVESEHFHQVFSTVCWNTGFFSGLILFKIVGYVVNETENYWKKYWKGNR